MALITTNEVIKHSIAEKTYPTDKIARFIEVVELNWFRHCLGKDFYDDMKAVIVPWENITEWAAGTYAQNAKVWWYGNVYNSKVNGNTQQPSMTASNWELAQKFTTAELDTLWKTKIVQIVANKIILQTAVTDTVKADAKGLVVQTADDSNMQGAAKAEISMWFTHVNQYVDMAQEELVEYIKERHDANLYDYSRVSFIQGSDEYINKQSNVSRRIAWVR